jgi:hypothetical protein
MRDVKLVPEWVLETFGATALELGLYETQLATADEHDVEVVVEAIQKPRRPAWLEME